MIEHNTLLTKSQWERKVSGYKKSNKSLMSKSLTTKIPAWFKAYYRVAEGTDEIKILEPGRGNFTTFYDLDGNVRYMILGGRVRHVAFNPNQPEVIPGLYFDFAVPDRVRKTSSLGEERVNWEEAYAEMLEMGITYRETTEYRGYVELISGKNDEA